MVEISGQNGLFEPLNTSNYTLDCGDASEALIFAFMSFTGPKMVREVLEYHPGANKGAWVQQIPSGKVTCEPITIAKAVIPADQLDNLRAWAALCMAPGAGKGYMSYFYRRPVKIMAKDNAGNVQRTVTLFDAYISSMKPLPDFAGDKPEIVVEEVEVQWQGWDLGGLAGSPVLPFALPV